MKPSNALKPTPKSEFLKEHPKKSGIRISRVTNVCGSEQYGTSYQVVIPASLAKLRIRKRFKGLRLAEGYAELMATRFRNEGLEEALIPNEVRADAKKARKLLDEAHLPDITLTYAAEATIRILRPAGGIVTVGDAADGYLAQKQRDGRRERTVKDARLFADLLKRSFGHAKLNTVSSGEIADWFHTMTDEAGWSLVTQHQKKNLLSAFFNWARQQKFIDANPAKGIQLARAERKTPVILTVEEAHRILHIASQPKHREVLPFFVLALFGGIRPDEIDDLSWSNVQLERQDPLVAIPPAAAKGRIHRNVFLEPNAVKWLMSCENRKGMISPARRDKKTRAVTKEAGWIDPESGHSTWGSTHTDAMRHSFASYYFALKGYDRDATLEQMGHIDGATVFFKHYRSATTATQGRDYFAIMPETSFGDLVPMRAG